MKLTETKDGTVIEVFVKPNQPKIKIIIEEDEIIIFATQEPVKGRVNKEIIKELMRLFHTKIELIHGSTSKQKRLLIKHATKDEVKEVLHPLMRKS